MPPLPPLECLRFFEAAARHESFVGAAEELQVTPPAVAYRVKVLENHIGHPLFDRSRRGLKLNLRGQACLGDVQCLLTEITAVMDRHRNMPTKRRLRIVAIESLAERWLMPKVAAFTAVRPDLAITLETDHVRGAPNRADFDLWITYDGEAGTPNVKILRREKLFEEPLFPVCSPQLLKTRGQPHPLDSPAFLAPALPSGLASRLVVLVHGPRLPSAGPVERLGLPSLQPADSRGHGGLGGGPRTPHAHCTRIATGSAGACV